jgi:hypothetical protein
MQLSRKALVLPSRTSRRMRRQRVENLRGTQLGMATEMARPAAVDVVPSKAPM